MPGDPWRRTPTHPSLEDRDVDVWRVDLEGDPAPSHQVMATLAEDERARAEGFVFSADRRRFVITRGAVRAILGRYLRRAPEGLRLREGPRGKPALAGAPGLADLRFNVSHSGRLALVAVARGREVGVDIERMREGVAWDDIAPGCFSARETAALRALPASERPRACFAAWTRKEAFAKARAHGLALPLDHVEVFVDPVATTALVRGGGEPAAAWLLRALEPGPGYAGAVVAQGRDWHLRCWRWSG